MKATGIICEYNPFHNGHLYHLEMVKKRYPQNVIIGVISSHFMQRGEVSVLNKWDKTELALEMGVDMVIELPFPFATQSADIFARGAVQILNALKVENIVFGSETNDTKELEKQVHTQLYSKEYDDLVQKFLKEGYNYPTALSKALSFFHKDKMSSPNDLLALSYMKAIKEMDSPIQPISIHRKGDYHDLSMKSIASASALRKALKEGISIENACPKETLSYLAHPLFIENYFPFLKYKIVSDAKNLKNYQGVEEGMDTRILKAIWESESLDVLIHKIKSKKYTYNRIARMLVHILCNFTKEEAQKMKKIEYIRVLGFSEKGREYLHEVKKEMEIPLITHFGDIPSEMRLLEQRVTHIYALLLPEKERKNLIEAEYTKGPIIKRD